MDRVYRGTRHYCSACGFNDSRLSDSAQLTELPGSTDFYLCRNCKDEYMDYIRRNETYIGFEIVHEAYVVAKRVASRSFKLSDVGKRLDLIQQEKWVGVIKQIFEMRREMAEVSRKWVVSMQCLNNVKEQVDEDDGS